MNAQNQIRNVVNEQDLLNLLQETQDKFVLSENITLIAFFFCFKSVIATPNGRNIHKAKESVNGVIQYLQNIDPCKEYLLQYRDEVLRNIAKMVLAIEDSDEKKIFFLRLEITKILGRVFKNYPKKK